MKKAKNLLNTDEVRVDHNTFHFFKTLMLCFRHVCCLKDILQTAVSFEYNRIQTNDS